MRARVAALALGLLLLAVAAPPACAAKKKAAGGGKKAKSKVELELVEAPPPPPSGNPYAGQSYGGCEGGYCPPADADLEQRFWRAAAAGDADAVRELLADKALNLTRNIVPDDEGLTRVLDVAVWSAAEHGRLEVMKVLLEHPGVRKLYDYEDGHIMDLCAARGDAPMVKLLLQHNMTVGSTTIAHAAHFNHTDVMALLLDKPMDLKAAMQAISNGGSASMARLMLKAMKGSDKQVQIAQGVHDWHADYIQIAAQAGNVAVLEALLEGDYQIKWQQAQDLVKVAAEKGDAEVFRIVMDQKLFKEDKDELEESVDNALKVAAEMGNVAILDVLFERWPDTAAQHCKAGVFRAMKFGQPDAVARLTRECPVDVAKSPKLQEADWLGRVLIAARTGDAESLKGLLAHERAGPRLRKLYPPAQTDASGKKQDAPQIPHPSQDPLVIAAVAGHLAAVRELERFTELCAPCAAAEASRTNQSDVIRHLAQGAARFIMTDNEVVVKHALRIVAYSMEAGNWDLVEWLVTKHESRELGPYFLPAIAQEGKMADLQAMLGILSRAGLTNSHYFKQQVHSATISAALAGHLDVMLELLKHGAALPDDAPLGVDEADDASDRSEL